MFSMSSKLGDLLFLVAEISIRRISSTSLSLKILTALSEKKNDDNDNVDDNDATEDKAESKK